MIIFINYINSLSLDIHEFDTIYSIKTDIFKRINIPISNQIIEYSGRILPDSMIAIDAGIRNNSVLSLTTQMKGGADTLTILFWIAYALAFYLFVICLFFGFIPALSEIYVYTIDYIISYIFTSLKDNSIYNTIIGGIKFLIKYAILYFVIYAFTSLITYPLAFAYTNDTCESFDISSRIGFYVTVVFIIIYVFLNIPDIIVSAIQNINMPLINPFIDPITNLIIRVSDLLKWPMFYAIPFAGVVFEVYHQAIEMFASILFMATNEAEAFQNKNSGYTKLMEYFITHWTEYPEMKEFVQNAKLEKFIDILSISFDQQKDLWYRYQIEQMPFYERINPFNKIAVDYNLSTIINGIFSFVLDELHLMNDILNNDIGTPATLSNMIKSGNLAGIFGIFTFIVCIILMYVGVIK